MAVIPIHNCRRAYHNLDEFEEHWPWDVIIIGTGMGGMACGAALAKYGRRVLMLEQHYIPGGFTHMFARKGFQWDVGVHAIGEMDEGDLPLKLLDWLTDGNVEMVPLGNAFVRFWFREGFKWELPDNRETYFQNLKDGFPNRTEALDKKNHKLWWRSK